MDEFEEQYQEPNQNGNWESAARISTDRWLVIAAVALLVVSGIALVYGYRQHAMVNQLTAQAGTTTLAMNQLQAQVSTLTDRLNEMTAKQSAATSQPAATLDAQTSAEAPANIMEAPAVTPSPAPAAKPAPAKRATAKRHTPADKRYAQLQTQLTEQQKKLNDMQEQVEKNRSDLEVNINSTRDELNGSIAKTHEELVALEKRGERNYVEFDLTKSKQFQRIGPLPLSLRKADTKHKKYDLALIVDDNELSKKQVNLYEPIWIHTENGAQPAMVVVNRIEKNLVHGYISTPKYKASELATANGASVTPVSGKSPDSNNTQNPQQPK
jgi:predicted  nucleic acid-binding Zn-ribbon protein